MESPWILVLCHEFPPLGGGAGKNLFLLCRELTRRGVKVEVWTGDPGARKRRPYDFQVDYFEVGRKARFETSLKSMAAFILRVVLHARSTRSRRPASVCSVLGIPSGIAGAFVARFAGVPHVVWYHGSDIHGGKAQGPGSFHRLLLRRIWQGAAMNFFVSTGLRDMALSMGKPKRPTILSACPSPEILAYPATGGEYPENRYFLFLGRFEAVKNPLLPLQAILKVKSRGKLTRKLRMVGSGDLGPEVQQFIRVNALSGTVVLEGEASFAKVPELLRSAYALILPSRMEGFNTTLLEAAHFGVPAIASDTHGIRDFVRHNENGLLFRENDAEALTEAMLVMAGDPVLRDSLGRKAKEAAAPFRPELVAETFLASVRDLIPAVAAAAGL